MYRIVPLAPSVVIISNTDMIDEIYRNLISEIIFLLYMLIYALICVAVRFNVVDVSTVWIVTLELTV